MQLTSFERWRSIIIFTLFFLIGYALIGFGPKLGTIEVTSPLDQAIPFIPFFIIFYIFGDIYLFLPFLLLQDRDEFQRFFIAALIMTGIAFLFFVLFPIELHKNYPSDGTITGGITFLYHTYDTPYNNFPSLHVAYTLFAWLVLLVRRKNVALWTAPIALGIILSVLFVKAHIIIDVMGGVALAICFFFWWKAPFTRTTVRMRRKPARSQ